MTSRARWVRWCTVAALVGVSLRTIDTASAPDAPVRLASTQVTVGVAVAEVGAWTVAADGSVTSIGGAPLLGSAAGLRLSAPVIGMAATTSRRGYWLLGRDGGVFSYGDARFYGSTGAMRLNRPVVGMASDPRGRGYWLVASDGGIFSFGGARFFGSTGALRLNRPVVGMAPSTTGAGYWLVASDGGIFTFGDAHFAGSLGALALAHPVVGMAADPDGDGYWVLTADGDVRGFHARVFGTARGALQIGDRAVGIAAEPGGSAYRVVTAAGRVLRYAPTVNPTTTTTSATTATTSSTSTTTRSSTTSTTTRSSTTTTSTTSTSTSTSTTTTATTTATTTTTTAPSSDPVVLAAGDIAACYSNGDEQTADVVAGNGGTVLTLGDNAYDSGTPAEFMSCYEPTWGRVKARTRPSPGNHDYGTGGAAGYFSYFGAAAGEPGKGYYSFNLGTWHVISLNSNCTAVACGVGSDQERWLRADLAASSATCTVAYWHHARYSSGPHGSSTATQALWQALYDGHADLVLAGHDHDYERFAPMDASGHVDTANGLRSFVVGTGGVGHYAVGAPVTGSELREDSTFGVLRLTLRSGAYDWRFLPVAGKTFSDAGSASCH